MAAVEIFTTDEFAEWYGSLDEADQNAVHQVVSYLEAAGLGLGTPHSSSLKGTEVALRELRAAAGRSPLRVIYAFDPNRDAVLIIGGDKSNDKKFYERLIRTAESIWKQYLEEQRTP